MYLGEWQIDDLLTFTVTTHTFATGALTDADSAPTYRVYEDETGTAILTGSMALLDDANTTGHYSEQITLSAANGFEVGKTYSVYITATVSSVTGGCVRSFQVEAAKALESTAQTVLADTNELQTDWANGGRLDLILDARASQATADDILTDTGTTLPGTLSTIAGYIDTEVASILAAVDTEVAAILEDTGTTLPATLANLALEATAQSILTDTAEIGAAGAGLTVLATQASVNDLPTNAELATALGTADDATLAAIAALNNLSAAQVNAEVVDVLRTDTIPDSYAADGAQPTIAQAVLMILQFLSERAVSSTTVTVKKPDGSTSAMTFTLDDASNPTSITRAS